MPFFIVKLQHNRACIVKSIIPDQSKYKVNVSDDGITLSCYLKIQKKISYLQILRKNPHFYCHCVPLRIVLLNRMDTAK